MNVLVLNAGSSSLKYQLINTATEDAVAKGICERIGQKGSVLKHQPNGAEHIINKSMPNHTVAIELVLNALVSEEYGVIKSMNEISAVGHRVVHSGEDYTGSVVIDEEVLEVCRRNSDLAPLHVPANIMGIEACKAIMPNTPMVAVFDTAFHSTMPDYAYQYGIKYEDYQDFKLRKYGFHGTSHQYVSSEAAKYLGKDVGDLKIVTCHLGNGSSITAVNGGKSVDTSMGFTPLEGLPMGTRSGDIDPAAIEYLMAKKGYNINGVISYLNKECGVLGVSGISSDFRDLCSASEEGDSRADLALNLFSYRVKKFIGSYTAAMNGLDCLVFTAGIGENTWQVRELVLSEMDYLGISVDMQKNKTKNNGAIRDITAPGGKVRVLIIPTNEELVIARETVALVG